MGSTDGGRVARVLMALMLLIGAAAASSGGACANVEMIVPASGDVMHAGTCHEGPGRYWIDELTVRSAASASFRVMWGDLPCGGESSATEFTHQGSRFFSESVGTQIIAAAGSSLGPISSRRKAYAPAVIVSCRDALAPCSVSLQICTRADLVVSAADDPSEEPEMISTTTLIWILSSVGVFVTGIIVVGLYIIVKADGHAATTERSSLLPSTN